MDGDDRILPELGQGNESLFSSCGIVRPCNQALCGCAMSQRRSPNFWLTIIGLLRYVMELLTLLSADFLMAWIDYSIRISFIPAALLLCAELFHRRVTDPEKTITDGWHRWLANKLDPLVRLGYKATVVIIAVSLSVGLSIAWIDESIRFYETENLVGTDKPYDKKPRLWIARQNPLEEVQTFTSLTPQVLMAMMETDSRGVALSQVGMQVHVRGTIQDLGFSSRYTPSESPSISSMAFVIEVAVEWDSYDDPAKIVYLHVGKAEEKSSKLSRLDIGCYLVARGTIQEIEKDSMKVVGAMPISANRQIGMRGPC